MKNETVRAKSPSRKRKVNIKIDNFGETHRALHTPKKTQKAEAPLARAPLTSSQIKSALMAIKKDAPAKAKGSVGFVGHPGKLIDKLRR